VITALTVDATSLRRRLPLTRRQVNEDWLTRYRGWVYGVGFGAQLGLGFVTLVACGAIYAAMAIEVVSGSAISGAIVGAAFGATKAGTLLPTRAARDPDGLRALHARLLSLEPIARRAVLAGEAVALVVLAGALL
jgi:hypothetical protein